MNNLINNTKIGFGSRNYPINPQTIHTEKKGDISLTELKEGNDTEISKLANFAITRLLDEREIPDKQNFVNENKEDFVEGLEDFYKTMLNSNNPYTNNTTVLVAKNEDDKIIGTATMTSAKTSLQEDFFEKLPKDELGSITLCFIDPEYKKQKLGTKMVNTLFKSVKDKFSNIFIQAIPEATGFWQKRGFKFWTSNDPVKQAIDKDFEDYEFKDIFYEKLMYKNTDKNRPFHEVLKTIKKEKE